MFTSAVARDPPFLAAVRSIIIIIIRVITPFQDLTFNSRINIGTVTNNHCQKLQNLLLLELVYEPPRQTGVHECSCCLYGLSLLTVDETGRGCKSPHDLHNDLATFLTIAATMSSVEGHGRCKYLINILIAVFSHSRTFNRTYLWFSPQLHGSPPPPHKDQL